MRPEISQSIHFVSTFSTVRGRLLKRSHLDFSRPAEQKWPPSRDDFIEFYTSQSSQKQILYFYKYDQVPILLLESLNLRYVKKWLENSYTLFMPQTRRVDRKMYQKIRKNLEPDATPRVMLFWGQWYFVFIHNFVFEISKIWFGFEYLSFPSYVIDALSVCAHNVLG